MNYSKLTVVFAAAAWLAIGPAQADSHGAACPLTYEVFESSVPHTDMETCPASMDVEGAYCRVSVIAETATIFAFSEETDCIVKSNSYEGTQFKLEIK